MILDMEMIKRNPDRLDGDPGLNYGSLSKRELERNHLLDTLKAIN